MKKISKEKKSPSSKAKSKPSEEIRSKRRHERSHSPISEKRRFDKRRLLKLGKESSSSSEDDASAIAAPPMSAAALAESTPRSSKPRETGIVIREQPP